MQDKEDGETKMTGTRNVFIYFSCLVVVVWVIRTTYGPSNKIGRSIPMIDTYKKLYFILDNCLLTTSIH